MTIAWARGHSARLVVMTAPGADVVVAGGRRGVEVERVEAVQVSARDPADWCGAERVQGVGGDGRRAGPEAQAGEVGGAHERAREAERSPQVTPARSNARMPTLAIWYRPPAATAESWVRPAFGR